MTRPRSRARRVWSGFALLALALAGLLAGGARFEDDPEGPGPLPWRVGGRVAFTVDAAAFPDSAGQWIEVYVRVPPATVENLTGSGPEGRGRLRVTAQLRDAYGGSKRSAVEEFTVDPADTVRGYGKVVLLRFRGRSGPQRLEVRLEDLLSRKRGLAYLGRRVTESATVKGGFEIPGAQAGRTMSSIEFIWSEDVPGTPGAFRRSGHTRLPNPERLYGLFAPELRAYFLAGGPAGDTRPWRWVARVLDARGSLVAERAGEGESGRWLNAMTRVDVGTFAAGGYDLELKAWQVGDSGAVLRRARFSIAWEPDSWVLDPDRRTNLVHMLLRSEQEDAFARMQAGEQEAMMNEFWRLRDPDPETPLNEAREEFRERIAIATQRFVRGGFGEGVLSDMGRVFVRYGEPSEVLKQVVPAGESTLLEALQELTLTEDRPLGDIHQKGPGGDMRPFEIWIYEGEIPLPPDAEPGITRNLRRKRLVFLFVDQLGTGDYTLRYSTE